MRVMKGVSKVVAALLILTIAGFAGMAYFYVSYAQSSAKLSALEGLYGRFSYRLKYVPLSDQPLSQALDTPRVGIVDITAYEQAPVLALMNVTGEVIIDGFTYYVGTVKGHPVVEVRAGEKDSSAEMAALLMDQYFNVTAAILSGIGGSRNPYINTGDVVVGAFVINKGSVHFHNGNYMTDYGGDEMIVTNASIIGNSVVTGYGEVGPVPANAPSYGYGPGTEDVSYVYVAALAASAPLVRLASSYSSLGAMPIADITGENSTGLVQAKVVVGVISSGGFWTDPISLNAFQNALYQADVGENEGWGFAFANAQYGVPWVIIRGISNSHFYPGVFHGVLAADRAAQVTAYVVENLGSLSDLRQTVNYSMLSPISEAKIHGYIVANRVYYSNNGTVTEVQYANQQGQNVTVYNPTEYPSTLPSP
ncbi:MAG: nucleoside phosphorylase [TACK group archaeon]|nr:nucleoside phosphorylase [TACK group archaeon]